MKSKKPYIYICSPLRPKAHCPEDARAELRENLERAKAACKMVATMGGIPICSHLFCTQFLDDDVKAERELGMEIGLEQLKRADELWVFSEYLSEGMLREITMAAIRGIPVWMFSSDMEWLDEWLDKMFGRAKKEGEKYVF
jgi:hypothetical protein